MFAGGESDFQRRRTAEQNEPVQAVNVKVGSAGLSVGLDLL